MNKFLLLLAFIGCASAMERERHDDPSVDHLRALERQQDSVFSPTPQKMDVATDLRHPITKPGKPSLLARCITCICFCGE